MTVDELKAWIESHFSKSHKPDGCDHISENKRYAVLPWSDVCENADRCKANLIWLKLIKPDAEIFWRVIPYTDTFYDLDKCEKASFVRLRFSIAMELQP